MRTTLCILAISFLFSSCATLLTKQSYKVKIDSNVEKAKVEVRDSIYPLPATIQVKRSRDDLDLKLITDTATIGYIVCITSLYFELRTTADLPWGVRC